MLAVSRLNGTFFCVIYIELFISDMNNNVYSTAEMTDMHFMYGRANGNSQEARRLYSEHYPNRRIPSHRMFIRIHQRLRETGRLQIRANDRGRNRTVRTPAVEERILRRVENDPGTSVRRIALMEHVSPQIVWLTLHTQLLYPYHVQRVQALGPVDFPGRRNFCRWFSEELAHDPNFSANVLCTDEAGFTRNGIMNFHNTHQWSDENPHAIIESRHQERFSINVWAGIIGDRLIGPFILPNR